MTVASYHLIRDDGFKSGPYRTNPLSRDVTVRAVLNVMVAEAGTPFSHRIDFTMADGSRVVARPKSPHPEHGA